MGLTKQFRVKIDYHEIQSDHMFASPTYSHCEYIISTNINNVINYITSKKDACGDNFKKSNKKEFGFDFTSRTGAVKYKILKFKRI